MGVKLLGGVGKNIAGRCDVDKGLETGSYVVLLKKKKKKQKHPHFKRTVWQPRNHNSPVKGMSQRLFREGIVSGSRGPFWKHVRSRRDWESSVSSRSSVGESGEA